jgi:minor extracellular protease Epr
MKTCMPRIIYQLTAAVALALQPFELANWQGQGQSLTLNWRQAHADDGGGDDGGDDGSSDGSAAAGADGGEGAMPFTLFSGGDHESREVLALNLTPAQTEALMAKGYTVIQQRRSALLAQPVTRLRVPRTTSVDTAIAEVGTLRGVTATDRNHFYRPRAGCQGAHCATYAQLGLKTTVRACNARGTVGLIDTPVANDHPALRGRSVEQVPIRTADRRAAGAAHGTAVAALLVGAPDSNSPGLLTNAKLIAADAFHRAGLRDDRMDAYDFAAALDALVARGAKVINLSFAGPANGVIERAVSAANRRGVILVAAVGNDGPSAQPRYPAAYPGVIAVTAVQPDGTLYRRAVRGPHVTLAAPGVDVWSASASNGAHARFTGTSFAAPFVTAAAAIVASSGQAKGAATARQILLRNTTDLGERGPDSLYGHGLIQLDRLCNAPRSVRG